MSAGESESAVIFICCYYQFTVSILQHLGENPLDILECLKMSHIF